MLSNPTSRLRIVVMAVVFLISFLMVTGCDLDPEALFGGGNESIGPEITLSNDTTTIYPNSGDTCQTNGSTQESEMVIYRTKRVDDNPDCPEMGESLHSAHFVPVQDTNTHELLLNLAELEDGQYPMIQEITFAERYNEASPLRFNCKIGSEEKGVRQYVCKPQNEPTVYLSKPKYVTNYTERDFKSIKIVHPTCESTLEFTRELTGACVDEKQNTLQVGKATFDRIWTSYY